MIRRKVSLLLVVEGGPRSSIILRKSPNSTIGADVLKLVIDRYLTPDENLALQEEISQIQAKFKHDQIQKEIEDKHFRRAISASVENALGKSVADCLKEPLESAEQNIATILEFPLNDKGDEKSYVIMISVEGNLLNLIPEELKKDLCIFPQFLTTTILNAFGEKVEIIPG